MRKVKWTLKLLLGANYLVLAKHHITLISACMFHILYINLIVFPSYMEARVDKEVGVRGVN